MKSFSRIAALALTVSMTAGLASAATLTFTDTSGNWAQTEISRMGETNVMTGYSDGRFYPDAWVTRTEFGNIGLRAMGKTPGQISSEPGLSAVVNNRWGFGRYDDQALISAYPTGVHRPDNPVRRVEAISAIVDAADLELVSEAEANQILANYEDASAIPASERRAVATAIQHNLFVNDPANTNRIEPLTPVTRAELAVMMDRFNEEIDVALTPTTTTQVTDVDIDDDSISTTDLHEMTGTIDINQDDDRMLTSGEAQVRMETVTLPANTTFMGTVARGVYSEFNDIGDEIVLILDHSLFSADGTLVAPAGSQIIGEITDLVSYNKEREPARMGFNFHTIITPVGDQIRINGQVANANGIISADAPQGVVFHRLRSLDGLRSEMRTQFGGLAGTEQAKMYYLEEPLVTLGSDVELDWHERVLPNFALGVGDKLQIRLDGAAERPVPAQ